MKGRQFDVYGFNNRSLAEIRKSLEELLNIRFEEHESTYHCGLYYRYESGDTEHLILQSNFDEHYDEWTEEEHRESKVLLYVNDAEEFKDIEAILLTRTIHAILLRREILK